MKGKIDGEEISAEIIERLESYEQVPKGAIVLVGENQASEAFVEKKVELAEEVGFDLEITRLPSDTSQEKVLEKIRELETQNDGVMVQLPLPDHLDENKILESIDPEKDIDGLTPDNLGRTLSGSDSIKPAAVSAIMETLKHLDFSFQGAEAVIVNDSSLIGRPLAMTLLDRGSTVHICHRETRNLQEKITEADLIVTATGEKGTIDAEDIPEDSVVIDAGYEDGEGDLEDYEVIAEKALVAEVPGGIGPVTVACTLENLMRLSEN